MPAAAKAKYTRQHSAKPYDRSSGGGSSRAAAEGGGEARRELRQSTGGHGLLGTPGRLISGALSWLSPWKAPGGEEDEDEDGEDEEGGEEEVQARRTGSGSTQQDR